jgi:hypothetical protein
MYQQIVSFSHEECLANLHNMKCGIEWNPGFQALFNDPNFCGKFGNSRSIDLTNAVKNDLQVRLVGYLGGDFAEFEQSLSTPATFGRSRSFNLGGNVIEKFEKILGDSSDLPNCLCLLDITLKMMIPIYSMMQGSLSTVR